MPDSQSGIDKFTEEVHLKIEVLHKLPIFRNISYQELVRVLNVMDVQNFASGKTVVEEGDDGDELYIVLTGRMRVHSGDTTITFLGPGQHFGEMALVDTSPRSASVTAVEESKLLTLKKSSFLDLIRRHHDMAVKLLWAFLGVVVQRLRNTSRELSEAREQLAVEDLTDELVTTTDVSELLHTEHDVKAPSESDE